MTSPETWNLCIAILTGAGYREVPARALVGRKLRDYAEQDVVDAFTAAAGKADPVAYASKILRMKGRKINGANPRLRVTDNSPGPHGLGDDPAPPIQTDDGIRRGLAACRAVLARREPGEE